jgi:hypothetical protein
MTSRWSSRVTLAGAAATGCAAPNTASMNNAIIWFFIAVGSSGVPGGGSNPPDLST